ncbi:MerR family transcriptional regulator [Kribbella speibonae]|uniref:MerR family transcriptional regulator n=1 Tax=Kribbella speibonae TaxID=1572660 RepID=A0A4R0IAT9_9ACTN|nr:MerR family transcriptional regulator [Kribbella speibonae]TCC28900.1 MerR family transcriptional regulator [Kribbella speibonae]
MTTYSPAEAAAQSGFSIDTLRYYEREGILPPIERSPGGRRVYSDGDLWMLGFLRCLRDTGMSIEQLRRYGELSLDDATMPERVALLEEHAASIRARITELDATLVRVQEKVDWYRGELRRTADGAS